MHYLVKIKQESSSPLKGGLEKMPSTCLDFLSWKVDFTEEVLFPSR